MDLYFPSAVENPCMQMAQLCDTGVFDCLGVDTPNPCVIIQGPTVYGDVIKNSPTYSIVIAQVRKQASG